MMLAFCLLSQWSKHQRVLHPHQPSIKKNKWSRFKKNVWWRKTNDRDWEKMKKAEFTFIMLLGSTTKVQSPPIPLLMQKVSSYYSRLNTIKWFDKRFLVIFQGPLNFYELLNFREALESESGPESERDSESEMDPESERGPRICEVLLSLREPLNLRGPLNMRGTLESDRGP